MSKFRETAAFQRMLPPKPKRKLKMEIQLHDKNSSRLEEIGCCTRTEEVEIKHQQCYHKVFVNK